MRVDLDVYRMRPGGLYPDESDYRTRFKVEFDLKTGLMRYPAVVIADFDGDGDMDLVFATLESVYPPIEPGDIGLLVNDDRC